MTTKAMRENQDQQQAYIDYFAMGVGRSLEGLVEHYKTIPHPPSISVQQLRNWARKYNWDDRVLAHQQRMMQKVELEEREYWREHRVKHRDKMLDLGDKLIAMAETMIDMPLVEREVREGGKVIILKPAKWSFSDLPAILKTADHLKRLALEMETARTTVNIEVDLRNLVNQQQLFMGLTDDEAEIAYQVALQQAKSLNLIIEGEATVKTIAAPS